MSSGSSTYLTVAVATAAVGLAAYVAYFDYKRRNDVEFRKRLKRDKKRVQKTVAQSKASDAATSTQSISPAELKDVLKQLKAEEPPKTAEERESYFMNQVALGEQLAIQGPSFYLPAAMAFYRALRVYPSPVELIVIYQKTIPEPVFKIVMDLTNTEVESRITGYYDYFPPRIMNVSVTTRPGQTLKQTLVVTKDFKAGEVIYREKPVVTALDTDLQEKGTYCAQCLRPIETDISLEVKDSSHTFPQTYCSKECMLAAKNQTHTLLFTLDNPLPPELASPIDRVVLEARRVAQAKFANHIKKAGRNTPLIVARFVARQVAIETHKLTSLSLMGLKKAQTPVMEKDFTDAEGSSDGYTLSDHIERLRYLEVEKDEEEAKMLADVLQFAVPGLEAFITGEKHAMISGKMAYNVFGVCYAGGRDDKPKTITQGLERTRTPYGTDRQIGSAFYTLSAYLSHSCQPSARPSFSSGTAEISIIANQDLQKGDEVTISFVDATRHPGEGVAECRQRRRRELANGWRFACTCERCKREAEGLSLEEKGGAEAEKERDESKIENAAKKFVTLRNSDRDVE